MNSRFLRNGIVTLVLVVGTAALLYMFIFPDTKANTVPYSGSGSLHSAARLTRQGVQGHPAGPDTRDRAQRRSIPRRVRPAIVTSAVPSELATNVQQDIIASLRGRQPCTTPPHIGRSAAIRQRPVAERADHGAAAHAAHRRAALLHVPPGAGHQQPGAQLRQEPRPHVPGQQDSRHVPRRRRRRRGQDGAPGSRRVPQVPREVQPARRAHPARRAAGRPARHRQDAARARRCRRGRRALLQHLRL